uniref:Uncharacterized protein n=1 Tax=Anguilla anguilla TaxID=7936 RepID=A0A0E9THU4_ANGAN
MQEEKKVFYISTLWKTEAMGITLNVPSVQTENVLAEKH